MANDARRHLLYVAGTRAGTIRSWRAMVRPPSYWTNWRRAMP